jgi:aminopeptidase
MKTKSVFLVVGVILVAALLGLSAAANAQQKGTDYEALAQKLVEQCAGIHEGDFVFVNGGVRDFELLEDIAVHVRKAGAFPLLTLGSDRLTRRMYTDVPAKYDSQAPELAMKLFNIITATITVDFNENEGLLADIPPERIAARGKASVPVDDLAVKRGIRGVNLGNELYPTAALAKRFGVPLDELSKIFWDGVNVDYSKLQATGEAVKSVLAHGKEVQITNPNGTDLKLRIEGRPVFTSDGVISAEDLKRGFAASQVYLPAGEVFMAPIPGSAEGKVVVDRQFFQGKEIQELTLTFKDGKLTSMTAKSGIEPLKALYDAEGAGKELFGFIDLGMNPSVHLVPGSRMVAWMPAGMVTVGIGGNVWAGGDNNNSYTLSNFLPGSTVKVDGKVLVENGVLKL